MSTTAIRIGPADNGRAMSLEEFRDADEEPGYRIELARGVVEVTEVPNDPHGEIECRLFDAISLYRRTHPGVIHRYGGAASFRLWVPGMISGRNPDVAVVLRGAPKDIRGRRVPALAIEVVSQGGEARDYEAKRQEYLVYGLFEYWIVDPVAKKVTVLIRDYGTWIERVFEGDQAITGLILPGFETRVSDLWADLDEENAEPNE